MKYPIGIQSFKKIRKEGFVYVDKTDLIFQLTSDYQYVFLGRPRRFGKSLLMSTLQAYFEGRRDLFTDLAIEKLETKWPIHPVIHLDFNTGNYSTVDGLISHISDQLYDYETTYGRNPASDEPQHRLRWIIKQACRRTGQNVVVLIDEYDKPILQAIGNEELDKALREILKPFFSVLKSEDQHIRFAMLSGVSKFGKLSVFSDLNNIEDISLNKNYASICGITEEEILNTFASQIDDFAADCGVSREQMLTDLRRKYDGYRFSKADILVYNPFSLLNSIKNRELNDYWFETGTPIFLTKLLKKRDYDLSHIEGAETDQYSLYQVDSQSPIPLLYQSGYLTIKKYDADACLYVLGYPNQEVEAAFLRFLLPYYSKSTESDTRRELYCLVNEIKNGDIKAFMTRLRSLFIGIPYAHDTSAKVQEDQVRNLIYLVFKLMSLEVQVECPMSLDRSDTIVWTDERIYVFEFKVDRTPQKAIEQIRKKGYAEPFRSDSRQIMLIGVNYSTEKRCITSYVTETL